ncbi:MAG TPA: CbiQ family ECF transporter T component [Opitutaceae bacterium]|nr:CbiQ family ECF transporter T component [Opitutaceae bacterium]
MRDDWFSPYRHRASLVHRLPAAVKLAAVVMGVVATVLLPRAAWTAYAGMGAAVLLVALLSSVPWRHLGRQLLLAEPVALGIAVLALWQADGLRVFAAMLAKSTLCLSWVILLNATTRFTEVLLVLRRTRVPALLVTTLALMHRYLFVLANEMGRLLRARRSRTFAAGRRAVWRGSATAAAQLFIRSSERAERVYAAMCARGWKP